MYVKSPLIINEIIERVSRKEKVLEVNPKIVEIDKELSKLETVKNSLKQEEESMKKVIQENIERNYNIFG